MFASCWPRIGPAKCSPVTPMPQYLCRIRMRINISGTVARNYAPEYPTSLCPAALLSDICSYALRFWSCRKPSEADSSRASHSPAYSAVTNKGSCILSKGQLGSEPHVMTIVMVFYRHHDVRVLLREGSWTGVGKLL